MKQRFHHRAPSAQDLPAAQGDRVPVRAMHERSLIQARTLQAFVDQSPRMQAQRRLVDGVLGGAEGNRPVLQAAGRSSPDRSAAASPVGVAQLGKKDSAIPDFVTEFFESLNTTYHAFKQGNWSLISQAHAQAHGAAPSTSGAAYTIDAITGRKLVEMLTRTGWKPHDSESRKSAIETSAAFSKARRQQGASSDRGGAPQLTTDDQGKPIRTITSHKARKKLHQDGASEYYYLKGNNALFKEGRPVKETDYPIPGALQPAAATIDDVDSDESEESSEESEIEVTRPVQSGEGGSPKDEP